MQTNQHHHISLEKQAGLGGAHGRQDRTIIYLRSTCTTQRAPGQLGLYSKTLIQRKDKKERKTIRLYISLICFNLTAIKTSNYLRKGHFCSLLSQPRNHCNILKCEINLVIPEKRSLLTNTTIVSSVLFCFEAKPMCFPFDQHITKRKWPFPLIEKAAYKAEEKLFKVLNSFKNTDKKNVTFKA